MLPLRPSRPVVAALLLLASSVAVAGPGDVAITAGAQTPIQLKVEGRKLTYFGVEPTGEPLKVEVQGPATFVLRFRALTFGRVRGVVELDRGGNTSVNRYDLERDYEQDLTDIGTSQEGALHIRAPAGKQTYTVRPLYGPPLAVRLLKTKTFDETLAAAPEGQPLSEPTAPVSGFSAMIAGRDTGTPPPEDDPPPVVLEETVAAVEPPPTAPAVAELTLPDDDFVATPSETPSLFTMKTVEESYKPPSHHEGFTMGFRGGLLVPFNQRLPALDFGALLSPTAALELGWDLGAAGTVFFEPAFHQVRRPRVVVNGGEEFLRSWSGTAGFMFPGPKFASGGLRGRLGLTGGVHETWRWPTGVRPSDLAADRRLVVGGVAGLGLEVKVSVIRLSFEARWTQLLSGVVGGGERETFGGVSLLTGYRVDF